ncbi:MAG: hypothetical protein EOO02_12055 [Chitinophagaceae bacterium]|nr:MAG: hypothetical protein EOO02_12055 [Chitinophagaceae bacterium]
MKKWLIIFIFFCAISVSGASAQCSMCSANAENGQKNGNTHTKGINSAVLYLLSFPFALAGGIGVLWYTKFRKPKS